MYTLAHLFLKFEIIRLAQPILSADLIQLLKDIKGIDTFTFIKRNGETFSREIQATYMEN